MNEKIHSALMMIYSFFRFRIRYIFSLGKTCIHSIAIFDPSVRVKRQNFAGKIAAGYRCKILDGTQLKSCGKGEIRIGRNVFINRNSNIVAMEKIVIEDFVTIGPNTCIYDHNHSREYIKKREGNEFTTKPIVIEKNAWIGANVVIMSGVRIGENSVIAAGSIVTKDIPANSMLIQKRESSITNI